eukprot:6183396-Pleurochrysis_carterae.AAC.2
MRSRRVRWSAPDRGGQVARDESDCAHRGSRSLRHVRRFRGATSSTLLTSFVQISLGYISLDVGAVSSFLLHRPAQRIWSSGPLFSTPLGKSAPR